MLHRQSYEALRKAYREGRFSPVDVIESALLHAEQVSTSLNAFALIDRNKALDLAKASASRWRTGDPLSPLDGMPFTVKEFAAVKGWPTRRGSLVTAAEPAEKDTAFVRRLLAAGAVLFAKTRAPEFNWKGITDSPGYGITRNPLDPSLTPGGSSGGCSAAVAAGVVRASIGSDAGGSVRIPAAFTGTFALKPTYGLIPLVPSPSAFFNVVHAGPIASSVAELTDVMRIVSGPDPADWSSVGLRESIFDTSPAPTNLRVGLLMRHHWDDSCTVVKQGMQQALDILAKNGFDIKTVDFDIRRAAQVASCFYRLGCLAAVQAVPDNVKGKLDPDLLAFVEPARGIDIPALMGMHQARDVMAGELNRLFDDVDVLMLPTVPIVAFEAGRNTPSNWPDNDWMSWNPYTPAFNLTQTPALSFPIKPGNASLPMGVQFVAAKGQDNKLIALAAWLEQQLISA